MPKSQPVGVVGNRYYYSAKQMQRFSLILVKYGKDDYILGGLLSGCLKFKLKYHKKKVPRSQWKDVAEHPKRGNVPIFHIVFICSRGYYPLFMSLRGCGISHFCGAVDSNCGNPHCFRLELTDWNRGRQDCDREFKKQENQRKMEKSKEKKISNQLLRCTEHAKYPCTRRRGKQYLKDFDILHYIERQSRRALPLDFDDDDYKEKKD